MLKFQLSSGGLTTKPMTLNALLTAEVSPSVVPKVLGEKSLAALVITDAKEPDTSVVISSTLEGIMRIVQSKRLAVCETLEEVDLMTRRV